MHIGLIGLGKMGFNMRERLRNGGIEVTGFDRNPEVTDVGSVDELIEAIPAPRLIWVMVPSGDITDSVITELGNKLDAGDLVIDGGNSVSPKTKSMVPSWLKRAYVSLTAVFPAAYGASRTDTA